MNYTAETMLRRSQDSGGTGIFASISAAEAGWDFLNMAARRLNAGQTWSASTGGDEYAHVILGGVCTIRTGRGEYARVGRRPNVFSGMPYALYLPRGVDFEIEALTDGFEVASCWVPTDRDDEPVLVTPATSAIELRGGGNASRQINSILPPGFPCRRIVAVEVYTPGGNWSSYPPHKHDVDAPPGEVDLDEVYYFRMRAPEGYGFQRLYTADGSIDDTYKVEDGDLLLIHEGYHPFVTAYGYDAYYFNVLAGSRRSMAASDDPRYAALRASWPPPDPRLPVVPRPVGHGMRDRRSGEAR